MINNAMDWFWVALTIILVAGFLWFGLLKKEEELPLHLTDDEEGGPKKSGDPARPYRKIKGLDMHQKKGSTWLGAMLKGKNKKGKFRK